MLIASGDFDVNPILDGAIKMALDQNSVHELNKKKGQGSWVHSDGWGIAYINEKGDWVIKKSTKAIYEDPLINEIRKIKTKLLILHVRRKVGSETAIENTHPFIIKNEKKGPFVFCHNGFIEEEIKFDSKYDLFGDTDSEKLFYSILTDLKKEKLDKAIRKNFKRYKTLSGTNIILSTKNKTVIAVRKNEFPEYYQMKIGKRENLIIVSSEIIPNLPEVSWEPIEQGDIVKIKHDKLKISISKQSRKFSKRSIKKQKKIKTIKTDKEYPMTSSEKKGKSHGN